MYYFVSAWYPTERPWYTDINRWYRNESLLTFNDTINQIKMFKTVNDPSRLLVLNYSPTLRYYLHEQDLFEVDYWSLFDSIQGIQKKDGKLLDFRELDWDPAVEFVYSPFLVLVRLKGETIAQVEFGTEGQLLWIDYFEDGQQIKRSHFDDRGFLSSVIWFVDGIETYQNYYNEEGIWQIRESLRANDGHVSVNPHCFERFNKLEYANMSELVSEKLREYFYANSGSDDIILAASSLAHNDLLSREKGDRKLIFSFFQNRFPLQEMDVLKQSMASSDAIVTDSSATAEIIKAVTQVPVLHLSLFDTRLTLGKSQRLHELILYFLVDGLEKIEMLQCLNVLFESMSVNENLHLAILSYEHDYGKKQELEIVISDLLEAREEEYLRIKEEEESFEIDDEDEREPARVALHFPRTELDIMKILDDARLIIDFASEPNLYTQIAGISTGIPQINRVASEFVIHKKNGYHVEDLSQLPEAIDYFVEGLSNWNKSLVESVQKIGEYTSGRLANRIIASVTKVENE